MITILFHKIFLRVECFFLMFTDLIEVRMDVLHHDLRYILLSLLLSFSISLFRHQYFLSCYYNSRFYLSSILSIFLMFLAWNLDFTPFIAYCQPNLELSLAPPGQVPGAPLMPQPQIPAIPDLNLPPGTPDPTDDKPWVPIILSDERLTVEEQQAVNHLEYMERNLIKETTRVLRSLDYGPREEDVKMVVSNFIMEKDREELPGLLFEIKNIDSPTFLDFLNEWEDHLAKAYDGCPVNLGDD